MNQIFIAALKIRQWFLVGELGVATVATCAGSLAALHRLNTNYRSSFEERTTEPFDAHLVFDKWTSFGLPLHNCECQGQYETPL